MLIFDPQEQIDDFFYQAVKQKQYDILNKPNKNLQFTFNHVFGGFSSNQEVYDEAVKCLLDGILNGYNCSGERTFIITFVDI